mmetsp:Transcript_42913/g.80055  ORF Transcript_42913/g.80055 Transcript_42913/m.80055 type:complete len:243 (+) Transcript_42913:25-753(+)
MRVPPSASILILACEVASGGPLALPGVHGQVQLVGFAGDQDNYNESALHMRWTGHVGLRFRALQDTVFGFTPDTALRSNMQALVSTLLEGSHFPGKVSDDFAEFADAAKSPFGTIFVFWDIDSCSKEDCGLSDVLEDVAKADKFYSFPPEAPRKYRGLEYSACARFWGETCFNCATYPKSLGLPIPDDSGMLPQYLEKMVLRPGAFCRCYKSGGWFPKSECWARRNSFLHESCAFEEPVKDL